MFPRFLAACVGGCVSTLLQAASPERASAYLDALSTLTAAFDQQVLDETGQLVQRSQGQLAVQRPGRFRWDYQTPYAQLIVGDGEAVWVYDPDLAQVSVRPAEHVMDASLAGVLSGELRIGEDFQLSAGEGDWVALRPRDPGSGPGEIRLALDDDGLHTLEWVDGLGQRTRIRLHELRYNPELDSGLFEFTLPPGVDVIGERP